MPFDHVPWIILSCAVRCMAHHALRCIRMRIERVRAPQVGPRSSIILEFLSKIDVRARTGLHSGLAGSGLALWAGGFGTCPLGSGLALWAGGFGACTLGWRVRGLHSGLADACAPDVLRNVADACAPDVLRNVADACAPDVLRNLADACAPDVLRKESRALIPFALGAHASAVATPRVYGQRDAELSKRMAGKEGTSIKKLVMGKAIGIITKVDHSAVHGAGTEGSVIEHIRYGDARLQKPVQEWPEAVCLRYKKEANSKEGSALRDEARDAMEQKVNETGYGWLATCSRVPDLADDNAEDRKLTGALARARIAAQRVLSPQCRAPRAVRLQTQRPPSVPPLAIRCVHRPNVPSHPHRPR